MDNLWIFIVIIGAVISLSQKSHKKASTESDNPTPPNPQEEWERQLRELLGDKEPHTPKRSAPSPTVSPSERTTIPKQDIHPTSCEDRRVVKRTPQPPEVLLEVQASRATSFAEQKAATKPKTNANGNLTRKAAPDNQGNDIDKIIEDFSMEKAVIYAEILKPKYEEY